MGLSFWNGTRNTLWTQDPVVELGVLDHTASISCYCGVDAVERWQRAVDSKTARPCMRLTLYGVAEAIVPLVPLLIL